MKIAPGIVIVSLLVLFAPLAPDAQTVSYQRNNSFTNWESPQVHPLDLTPDGTRLLAVNTANGTLEIYNSSVAGQAPTFVASVPVGVDPVSVRARTNTEAWVVNVISDTVSVVDLQNGIVTATLQADDEPADVIFAGSGQGEAFVSCAQAKTLMVFNALAPASSAPTRVLINGEQPRMLASSPDGRYVYLAIFESGNATTILPGGVQNGQEHDVVRDPSGPYGGVNAPPNSGTGFSPALNPANPAPIPVSLIVRKVQSGKWVDDNGIDWSAFVTGSKARTGVAGDRVAGWDLPDRDVAIIDTQNNNALTYQTGLMNMVMAIGVNPGTGQVTVVGTEATNQIRFEPVLQSTFVHVEGATFTPGGPSTIFDLNPHITYKVKSVPMAQRLLSIGDPRGIVWNAAGTTSYTTGMGSNNVILTSNTGARLGLINVGQGPTGIVLNESNGRAFVLNRFDATISTINLGTQSQAFVTPLHYDPTPAAIKAGRPVLYNTHLNSGLGQASCGSCHVDARTDRLAWDLGNPAGAVVTNAEGVSFHPMKGPLLTMTMVDMMQSPFLHWRGDRQLNDFEGAFETLQGGDAPASDATMALMQQFLATITLPPNPFRNLDNSYSTSVPMPGPNHTIYTTGNAVLGAQEFEANCRSCHVGETNRGAAFIANAPFGAGVRNPPNWKNFYKRMGLWFTDPTASTVGFGTQQDGTFDSSQNQTRDANMYAFMMSFNGGYPYEPAGLNQTNWSNYTHAAVGKQVTLSPSNPTDTTGLLTQLETLAGQGAIGLVAKGGPIGSPVRGWMYLGNNLWQSDHLAEVDSTATLTANVAGTTALTFTAVPTESAVRVGIDMDSDGILDADDQNPASPDDTVTNLALTGTATAVTPWDSNHQASAAIDGSTMGYFDQNQLYHSGVGGNDWWQVDLGTSAQISLIQLFNRWDCCGDRLSNVSVFVSQTPFTSTSVTATRAQAGVREFFLSGAAGLIPQIPMQTQGRYVRVQLNQNNYLQLAEVRVMGYAIGSFVNPGAQSGQAQTPVTLPVTFNNTSGNSYTFTAANLPPGLSVSSSNGTISGTPTTAGTYTVTLTAVGAGNPTISFPWTITSSSASFMLSPQVSSLSLAPAASGSFGLSVVPGGGFNGTVSFTLSGLPPGVTGSAAATAPGAITNVVLSASSAAVPGSSTVTIQGTSGTLKASTSFTLVILTPQTLTFNKPATQVVGTPLPLTATASSSLPVSYTSSSPAVCTVSGSSATFLAPGTCMLTASQPGSSTYAAAPPVTQTFTVGILTAPVPVNLASVFNVYGIDNNGVSPANGGFDGSSYAYSANLLGSTVTALGVPFTLGPAGGADAVANATVPIPAGSYSALDFLAAGVQRNQPGSSFVLTYTDGSTSTVTQSISDWGRPQSYAGETIAAAMSYRINPAGGQDANPYDVYAYSIPVPSGKVVKSITLPQTRDVVVLAMTLVPLPSVVANLAPAFNVYGIANNGVAVTQGGFDTSGYAYSANGLPSTITLGGVPVTLGPAGAPDAVAASTVTLPQGNFAALKLLAGAAYGPLANQSFVVTYTDGSTATLVQSMSDWGATQTLAGETILVTDANRVTANGTTQAGPWHMYGYTLLLNPAKTVSSITLPSNRDAVVFALSLVTTAP